MGIPCPLGAQIVLPDGPTASPSPPFESWDMETQMRSLPSCIKSLPTKSDFECYVKRIEHTYKQEISELKKDLGVYMEDIENTTVDLCTALQSHEEILNSHIHLPNYPDSIAHIPARRH